MAFYPSSYFYPTYFFLRTRQVFRQPSTATLPTVLYIPFTIVVSYISTFWSHHLSRITSQRELRSATGRNVLESDTAKIISLVENFSLLFTICR